MRHTVESRMLEQKTASVLISKEEYADFAELYFRNVKSTGRGDVYLPRVLDTIALLSNGVEARVHIALPPDAAEGIRNAEELLGEFLSGIGEQMFMPLHAEVVRTRRASALQHVTNKVVSRGGTYELNCTCEGRLWVFRFTQLADATTHALVPDDLVCPTCKTDIWLEVDGINVDWDHFDLITNIHRDDAVKAFGEWW